MRQSMKREDETMAGFISELIKLGEKCETLSDAELAKMVSRETNRFRVEIIAVQIAYRTHRARVAARPT